MLMTGTTSRTAETPARPRAHVLPEILGYVGAALVASAALNLVAASA